MNRLMAALLLVSAVPVFAQRPPEPPRAQEINIKDDELIEGSLDKPDGALVTGTARPRFSNLIQVRKSFAEKVMTSEAELP